MFVIGAGLGMFMQIMTLAVQNATDRADLGSATSSVAFFRSLGGSLGGAIFGSILVARLTHHINDAVPGAGALTQNAVSSGVAHLPVALQQPILQAYVTSFHDMFLLTIPFTLAAFVVALYLRETPLKGPARETAGAEALD
jgi:hypothetical protein